MMSRFLLRCASLLMILCVLSLVCVCACEAIVARLLLEERYCVCVCALLCVSLCVDVCVCGLRAVGMGRVPAAEVCV